LAGFALDATIPSASGYPLLRAHFGGLRPGQKETAIRTLFRPLSHPVTLTNQVLLNELLEKRRRGPRLNDPLRRRRLRPPFVTATPARGPLRVPFLGRTTLPADGAVNTGPVTAPSAARLAWLRPSGRGHQSCSRSLSGCGGDHPLGTFLLPPPPLRPEQRERAGGGLQLPTLLPSAPTPDDSPRPGIRRTQFAFRQLQPYLRCLPGAVKGQDRGYRRYQYNATCWRPVQRRKTRNLPRRSSSSLQHNSTPPNVPARGRRARSPPGSPPDSARPASSKDPESIVPRPGGHPRPSQSN